MFRRGAEAGQGNSEAVSGIGACLGQGAAPSLQLPRFRSERLLQPAGGEECACDHGSRLEKRFHVRSVHGLPAALNQSSCRLPRCSTSSREGVARKKSENSGPKLFDWLLVGALQNIALRKLRMRVEISVLGCERDFHFVDNFFRTKFEARQLCTLGESSDGLSDRGFSYALGIVEQADLESASRCS